MGDVAPARHHAGGALAPARAGRRGRVARGAGVHRGPRDSRGAGSRPRHHGTQVRHTGRGQWRPGPPAPRAPGRARRAASGVQLDRVADRGARGLGPAAGGVRPGDRLLHRAAVPPERRGHDRGRNPGRRIAGPTERVMASSVPGTALARRPARAIVADAAGAKLPTYVTRDQARAIINAAETTAHRRYNRPGQPPMDARARAARVAERRRRDPEMAADFRRQSAEARRSGRPRMARAGGWYCPLVPTPCTECGQPLLGPAFPRRSAHGGCLSARRARYFRERRAGLRGNPTPSVRSTRYVAAWRRRHPDRDRLLRERDKARRRELRPTLPPEVREGTLERAHAYDREAYAATLEAATTLGQRWTEDDDAYVLANLSAPAAEVAAALGRTLWAVRGRRVTL